MAKPKIPNWAQTQLQNAAGLGDLELNVTQDDDCVVIFRGVSTGDEYFVAKRDGQVKYFKNPIRVVERSDRKRERPTGGNEGFL